MYVEKHGNSYLKGEITVAEGQTLVFTTIPYDAGWNVYVDGKKVETIRTLSALLSFEVSEGYHTLELRYMPKCYVIGFIATGIGILLFAFFIVITKVKKVRSKVFAKAKFLGNFINSGEPAAIEATAAASEAAPTQIGEADLPDAAEDSPKTESGEKDE